jgi:tetratricopeptide (TPR) repeat protein
VSVVSALRVYLERIGGDPRGLSSALAELSFSGAGTTQYRADLLVEAAQIAEKTGDNEGAIAYYRAACGTVRGHALARLGLAILLYRLGRYRSKEQAEYLLELTEGLDLVVPEDSVDLAVYVRAQAFAAIGKSAHARGLFEDAESKYGPKTFLVLGLAEMSAWSEDFASALGYFAAALGGNLRALRRPSEVALLAARTASAAGDVTLALNWLEPSLTDDSTRPEALTLQAELLGAVDAIVDEGQSTLDVVEMGRGNVGAAIGRIALKREPFGAKGGLEPEVEAGTDDGDLEPDTVVVDIEPMSVDARSARAVAVRSIEPDVLEQGWSLPEQSVPEPSVAEPSEREVSPQESVTTAVNAQPDLLEQGWSLPEHSQPSAPEPEPGSAKVRVSEPNADDFALAIAEELSSDPERQRAWLSDGRRWLRQWPTNARLVELVRSAAAVEGHHSYVHALTQALGVLRGERETLEPPDLSEQPVEVDVVRAMLLRDTVSPGTEALELIWDGAEHEFVREPSEYEITGLMRVVGSASPMARIYADAARRLGMTRTPLFFRKLPEPIHVRVILLSPPSILIEGEPFVDERFLSYQLGSSLWATLPAYSLLFGLPKTTVQQVYKALLLAFGSGEGRADRTQGESLRLAQVLWQTIKSRSQRKLKEICLADLSFDDSFQRASQSLRRAGLYVSGDLATAIASLTDEQFGATDGLSTQDVLLRVIGSEAGLDLFRFATSAEYADMRWQSGRVISPVGASRPWQ